MDSFYRGMRKKGGRILLYVSGSVSFFTSRSVFLILELLPFGLVQYAHRKCVQHWCDEKGDITCEICHQV